MNEIEDLVSSAGVLAVQVPHVAELAAIVGHAGEWAGRAQRALAIHVGCVATPFALRWWIMWLCSCWRVFMLFGHWRYIDPHPSGRI